MASKGRSRPSRRNDLLVKTGLLLMELRTDLTDGPVLRALLG